MRARITIAGFLHTSAATTVVFSLLTGIGITHHTVELFCHFRLQYFIVSALLMLIYAFRRQWLIACGLLLVSTFSASLIAPLYFDAIPQTSGKALKLVHANVHASSSDHDALLKFVQRENPDILFLQEITAQWVDGIRDLSADYPYAYTVAQPDNFGIAVFSKIALDSVHHVYSPPLRHPTIVATISFDDQPLTLVSTHPSIPLGHYLYNARNEQIRSIADLAGQVSGHLVLMGDFNASVWDPRLIEFQQETGLHNTRFGFGFAPTWPTYMPVAMIPIDHAFVSGGIGVLETRTGAGIGSDHLPLVVSITL